MQQGAPQTTSTPGTSGTPSSQRARSNVEVVILTFNEELNLPWALQSVCGWADAVYAVDSGSTDGTRKIAESFGAKIVDRSWLGYAAQKNWALDNLPIKSDWVFILDADEAITSELRDEILAITTRDAQKIPYAGYYINRLTYFLNRPIRHCGYFPSYNLRLFKRGKARYEEREVHEHMVVDGSTERLKHLMLHNDRRSLENYVAKHNRYSTLEARALIREAREGTVKDATELDQGVAIRRWLKRNVFPRLPLSFLIRFIYMYIGRLGILDGANGLRFCLFLASYDLFIHLKMVEVRESDPSLSQPYRPANGLSIPEGMMGPTDSQRASS